jgi:hypothetical protein
MAFASLEHLIRRKLEVHYASSEHSKDAAWLLAEWKADLLPTQDYTVLLGSRAYWNAYV